MTLRRDYKIFFALLLSIFILLFLTIGIVQTQWGQNWLAEQVTKKLSKDLQSRISIKRVQFSFFNKMDLEEVLVEDRKKDTLLWAGKVQVRITDWFFFQNKVELKYIGLQDAIINLQRTDSIWNYQYLQDYFASPSTGKKKKRSGIEFNLKKVVMQNVVFLQKDGWIGKDLLAKIGSLELNANDISITRKTVDITNIELVKPFFQSYEYAGKKPATTNTKISSDTTTTSNPSLQWNPQNWNVAIDHINIKDGVFKNDKGRLTSELTSFDGKHINFSNINGKFTNFLWTADTLHANVDISTTERSGLAVKSLKTKLRFNPQLMEFDDLYLQTNKSILRNYFAMKFATINSMSNFIHAVTMQANFQNSHISSDDLAFFAPNVRSWKKTININGQASGTVDALAGKNLTIKAGNTFINGDMSIIGLPDVNSTFINVKANNLNTTYGDMVSFVPALKNVTTPNLRKLTYLRFNGTFTGFLNDFVTYGTLQTNMGNVAADLNMKLPKGLPPVYSGKISTNNFQLGQFINNTELGAISFEGNIKGRGVKLNELDMNIDGKIHKISYKNYTYQNIIAKGRIGKKVLDGDFILKDPNADMHLTGSINLSGAQPVFNMQAAIENLNLRALHFTKEEFTVRGDFDLNFHGNSLADFIGKARISNASILQGGQRLSFDSLIIAADYINGVKKLQARSNEFDLTVTGTFDLNTLPDAFTVFLNRYYPSYIRPPRRNIANQSFTFDITTGIVDEYIKLVDKRLSGFNNSHITGTLNVATNTLNLDADVPQFAFNQYEFSDVKLNADGNFERLLVAGQVNNALISDSLNFPVTTFIIQAQNDISDITINTNANQTINQATISAQVKTFSNGASIVFKPSSFVINGKTWTIEQGGELDFRQHTNVQGQLVLKESTQEIRINTQPSDVGDWNDLNIVLQNLNLGDLSPYLLKKNRIEGLLSGEIKIEDPKNKFNIISNIKTDQLRLDSDSIGQVETSVTYDNKTGSLKGFGNNLDPEHKILFEIDLDLKDSAKTHTDRISVQPINYPVKILERFLGTLFTDMQGFLTGKLDILGEGVNRDYVGKAQLTNAGLKVKFTQVIYKIQDTEIELTKNAIELGTLKLVDKEGNTATVSGNIQHNSFRNMFFDITARVDSRPMELLNTGFNDNQQFYGRAKGIGSMILSGPQSDMQMTIIGRASDRAGDSSFITLPPARYRESGAASFMVERKYGREMTVEDYRGTASNITYDIDLTANPLLTVEVILDELTGDVIRGRGEGNLQIRGGTSEPLTIRGRYNIEQGSYLFTFQSLFKKPFILRPNSTNYIEWTGDPYDADIQFNAIYRAENVSFAPLVTGLSITGNSNLTRYRGDVNVITRMTGKLFQPTFNFQLEFPEGLYNSIDQTTAFSLQQGIKQIESNQNEINKQVTYLIVTNSFAPYESSQTSYSRLGNEFIYSTISGLIFDVVNRRLNQLLSGILRNNDLTVNFTGSLYNSNLIDQNSNGFINQSNLNITVGKALFNERIIVTLGGSFDVPIGLDANIEQNIQLFPDVNVEFLINKTGTVRATVFYRQSPDLLTASSQTGSLRSRRAGVNLAYRKEINSLSEPLFGRKKGKKKGRVVGVETANPVQ